MRTQIHPLFAAPPAFFGCALPGKVVRRFTLEGAAGKGLDEEGKRFTELIILRPRPAAGRIRCRERLGGMLKYYYRAAA